MKIVFKIFDALQSHTSPKQTATGIALGAFFGLSPFWSLQALLTLGLLFSVRMSMIAFSLSTFVFTLWYQLGISHWHRLGESLLSIPGLFSFWTFLDNRPFLPFLRLTETRVLGAFLAAVLIPIPLFFLARFFYPRIQKPMYRWLWAQPFFRNSMGTRLYRMYANYRKQEPVRWTGMAVGAGLASFVVAYLYFFAGWHLKKRIEAIATQLNGAEASIESLVWTPLSSEMTLRGIAFANYRNPLQDFLRIESATVQIDPWRLATGRISLSKLRANGFLYNQDRDTSGALEFPTSASDLSAPAQASALYGSARAALDQNPLINLGLDVSTRDFERTIRQNYPRLRLSRRLQTLQKDLNTANAAFLELETKLPSERDLNQLRERFAEGHSASSPSPHATLERHLTNAREVYGAMETRLNTLQETIYRSIEISADDRRRLKEALGIPDLSHPDLSQALFGDKILNAVERISSSILWLRQLSRPGTARGTVVLQKRKLERFNTLFSFDAIGPRLQLDHGEFGTNADSFSGSLSGLTTSPLLNDSTLSIALKGSFPDNHIEGFSSVLEADHRHSFKDRLRTTVKRFPLKHWVLQSSRGLEFEILAGNASLEFEMTFDERLIEATVRLPMQGLTVSATSRNQALEEILNNVARAHSKTLLIAKISGDVDSLRLQVSSSLGRALATQVKQRFESDSRVMESNLLESYERFAFKKTIPLKTQLDRLNKKNFLPAGETLKALNEMQTLLSKPVS